MKNTILYSLFIVSTISFSLHSQDTNVQDEDLIFVFDDGNGNPEEIYPLEDIDTICLMPEIKNYSEDLELDSIVKLDATEDVVHPVLIEATEESLPEVDKNVLLEAMDHDNLINLIADDDELVCQSYENQMLDRQLEDELSNIETYEPEDCPINLITQDQLEEIFHDYNEPLDTNAINSNEDLKIAMPHEIVMPNTELSATQATELSFVEEDDDIISVPHDLINSVKKANKQKKKLEKLERKEKANFFKKSKKQQKKKN